MTLVLAAQGKNSRPVTELNLSNNKKDLTRIEDLGEFIHELNAEEELTSEEDSPLELPDLPLSDEASSFDSSSLNIAFGGSEEVAPDFESSDFVSPSFETSPEEFSTDFTEDLSNSEFESVETTFEGTSDPDSTYDDQKTEESSSFSMGPLDEQTTETSWNVEEPITEAKREYKTPENFADLKQFSEHSSFTGMATEGNPSFSVLIKQVRYIEDINDIVSLLRELSLLSDSEEQTKGRLMRGTLLIPRISEFAAIFLAHKLRRFDIDIQVGLSDEVHPPRHHETPETGIVSKHNLFQNQAHHFEFQDPKLEISQIIVAATPSLEGYHVVKYMGVASEHKMLPAQLVEDENSSEIPAHYQELAQKLKAHALKAHSNAVVGLNYQLTPIPTEFGMSGHKYRLTCTGNLVWVNKL